MLDSDVFHLSGSGFSVRARTHDHDLMMPTLPRIGDRFRPETEFVLSRDDLSLSLSLFLSLPIPNPLSLDSVIGSTSGACGFVTSCGPLFRSSTSTSRATASPRQMTVSEGTEGTPILCKRVQQFSSYMLGRRCCCCWFEQKYVCPFPPPAPSPLVSWRACCYWCDHLYVRTY